MKPASSDLEVNLLAHLHSKYRHLANAKWLNRLLQPLPPKRLRQRAHKHGFDGHARKIFFQPYFRALRRFQMTDDKSLRDGHAALRPDPWYALSEAPLEVSLDALSHANAIVH